MLNLLLERKAHVLKDYLYIRTYILSRTKEQDRALKAPRYRSTYPKIGDSC